MAEADRMSWGSTVHRAPPTPLLKRPLGAPPSPSQRPNPVAELRTRGGCHCGQRAACPQGGDRDGDRDVAATPLTSPSAGRLASACPRRPGHRARGSSPPRPHAAPAPRAAAWDLRQAWRRGGRRNGRRIPDDDTVGQPRETAGGTSEPPNHSPRLFPPPRRRWAFAQTKHRLAHIIF